MDTFNPAELASCRTLIKLALAEDLGERGDVTSQAVIPADLQGRAVFVARAAGVLAGLPACQLVLETLDACLTIAAEKRDGDRLAKGDRLGVITGNMRSILAAERTALNFLQHLSGVASLTRKYVDAVEGLPVKILDTRKTLPGWRLLEKYAVRCGGGHNHRMGLYDAILIKDNHLAALRASGVHLRASGVSRGKIPIEVEVETLHQLEEAIHDADIVLLDNMPLGLMRDAVRRRNALAPKIQLEASGGVTLETVRAIAETGVDRISIGALTHSAPALDIALDYET